MLWIWQKLTVFTRITGIWKNFLMNKLFPNLSFGKDELQSLIAPPERLYLPNIPGRMQLDLMAGY